MWRSPGHKPVLTGYLQNAWVWPINEQFKHVSLVAWVGDPSEHLLDPGEVETEQAAL